MIRSGVLIGVLVLATMPAVAQDEATDTAQEGSTSVIDELSQAELDSELERVEQVLGDDEELTEFTPARPLPADLPIALPSDI